MILRELNNDYDTQLFHEAARKVHSQEKGWIPANAGEVEMIFNPEHNTALKKGQAKRWVALNENWKPIGRVAAFFNSDTCQKQNGRVGGIGFYECVDDPDTSDSLLQQAEDWLRKFGMTHVDGPVNFGERHQFYGLLIESKEKYSVYQENYNPKYCKPQFERRGYKKLFDSYTFKLTRADYDEDRLRNIKDYLFERYDWEFRHLEKDKFEQFADDYFTISRQAFNLKNRLST